MVSELCIMLSRLDNGISSPKSKNFSHVTSNKLLAYNRCFFASTVLMTSVTSNHGVLIIQHEQLSDCNMIT